MFIIDSKVNVVYEEVEGIVKKFYISSDYLEESFEEAEYYPLPEDAPAGIPRFVLKSKGGYSELYFAKNIMQLETKYDGAYRSDWALCAENISQKIDGIYKVLDMIAEGKYLFSGIKVRVIYDEEQKNGTQRLKDSILKINSQRELFDIDCKLTYVDNGWYINIALANVRSYEEEDLDQDVMRPGMLKEGGTNAIMVTIDVNDRYSYNADISTTSSGQSMKKMIQKVGEIMKNMPTIIEKGEIRI